MIKMNTNEFLDIIAEAKANYLGLTLTIIMHPADATELLKDMRFFPASNYSSHKAIKLGEIGSMFGVPIIVSSQVLEGNAVIVPEGIGIQYGEDYAEKRINPSRRKQEWEY